MGKFVSALLEPQKVTLKALRLAGRFCPMSFQSKLDLDLLERPNYAYCLANAAKLARALKIPRISAVEFGVAGGAGLLALEKLAGLVEETYGVGIQIWGFDTGEGLPEPVDYRDLPYIWKRGAFKMDQQALKEKLTRSQLVLGDVRDTVPTFLENRHPAPLGALFLDLDYWSSTRDALDLLRAEHPAMLPRVFCYFDDVVSVEGEAIYCEDTGQLRAINEYNGSSKLRKLRKIEGLPLTRPVKAVWNSKIYVHHTFDHPSYCTYVYDQGNRQLELRL